MPPAGVDRRKWSRCVDKVKRSARTWPSAYASFAVSKCYKASGGRYAGKKDRSRGTARWKDEQWIDVEEFARHGRRVACGAPGKAGKACRPSKRVSPKTPMTVQEAIERHGRSKVVRLARKKSRNMDMRTNWKRG